MVYVDRPEWMDRLRGETTEWLLYTSSGSIKYIRARTQVEALKKAVRRGIEVSDTNDIRPRVGRRDARLMSNREFAAKLGEIAEKY